MKAIILTDGKAGHESQSKAFARAIGCETEIVKVAFVSRAAKTASYLLDRLGVRTLKLFDFGGVKAADLRGDVIIGAGSGTFYAVKALAKKLHARSAAVLYPRGYDIASFDCIIAPAFDNPPKRANIVTVPVNLVANDEKFYADGVAAFQERHAASKRDAVAVVVGGPNKCSTMTPDWMKAELEKVFAATPDCEHWVTTSRRTPPETERIVDSFPFDYKLIYSRDHFNPIPAFVALAKRIYVTAESTGMISEACSHGKAQVFVLDNLCGKGHKFRRFVDSLAAAGYLGDEARKVDLTREFAAAKKLLE